MCDDIVQCGQIGLTQEAVGAEASDSRELSGRALNVLKLLTAEMTGEQTPRKDWVPSDPFLRKLSFERLVNARNCGPLTAEEIIRWARSRGIIIEPPSCAGRSFPQIWRHLEARFATGEVTRTEIAEVIERSVRRKNTKIPVPVQRILLKLLCTAGEDGTHS